MNDNSVAWLPRRANTPWMVQCDFDGTISLQDVTDSLLQRFGLPGWQALEDAWDRGEIGSRACMQGQVALLDMGQADLLAHLDGLAMDPHFPAFVRAAHARGMVVQVVSDGLDRAIRHILGRHGLGELPVFANHLLPDPGQGDRRWRLQTPHAAADCKRNAGNCKCARAAEQQARPHPHQRRVLYIGDGSSDFCVAARADLVLAKDKLLNYCVHHGIPHRAFSHFGEALELMQALTALPSLPAPLETTA
jgi:2,3-diketo-5-methylthio-1-phosphopentane phosphatase